MNILKTIQFTLFLSVVFATVTATEAQSEAPLLVDTFDTYIPRADTSIIGDKWVKVKDKKSGKRYWREFDSYEDLLVLRNQFFILKTRKDRKSQFSRVFEVGIRIFTREFIEWLLDFLNGGRNNIPLPVITPLDNES